MLYKSENPHGGGVYGRKIKLDFSVNTNPLGTPPAAIRAVVESTERLCQYPDPHCGALVSALAEREGVPEECVQCGGGAAELIFSYCLALRPRRALELAPTFSEYSAALEAAGCRVERCPLLEENGFAVTDTLLEVLAESDCDTVFLCNPNNPTGRLIEPNLLEEILRLCRRRGIRLFVDECFLDLSDGWETSSLKKYVLEYNNIFILKAFTKTYGMAGLRLGYCLSGDQALLSAMSRLVQPWNVSLPAQAAGVAALGERRFLEEARALIRRERPRLRDGLEKLGFTVCPSQANYLLFKSSRDIFHPLLEQGILLRDCSNYRGLGPGWYRTAVKLPEENQALIQAMGDCLCGGCAALGGAGAARAVVGPQAQ